MPVHVPVHEPVHEGPRRPVPGDREPGMLTRFAPLPLDPPEGVSTMDAATVADRQREGGGAPGERRQEPEPR